MSQVTDAVRRLIIAHTFFGCVASTAVQAQAIHGVVLDQTGLPLPGARVQLLDRDQLVTSRVTDPDGQFALEPTLSGDTILVTLEGFESVRVGPAEAERIVLSIARATDSTTVTATAAPATPTGALLGSTVTGSTVARLPSSHMKARESLPLLPSVVRGVDGLLQLGGARANDTPLLLDGFNVTDPATGLSSVNLPFEAVSRIDVLREPMAVTYGGLIGGLQRLESRSGSDAPTKGVQGFVPRPRFASPGFGRLEGIFPRGFISGSSTSRRFRYLAAAEYDYERIAVSEVTQGPGPNLVQRSLIAFARADAQLSPRHEVTIEGFAFPNAIDWYGLSPRREEDATINVAGQDLFGGLTYRYMPGDLGVVTLQLGVLTTETTMTPNGDGGSWLSPTGWKGNWFRYSTRRGHRNALVATWQRIVRQGERTHDVSLSAEVSSRRLTGTIAENPVLVNDAAGRLVRSVAFGPGAAIAAHDRPVALVARDAWHLRPRVQIDAGARIDHSGYTGGTPSGRIGVRYALDESDQTVLKAGVGTFAGTLPLMVPAFAAYPTRRDGWVDAESGQLMHELLLQPRVGRLRHPYAAAETFAIERQVRPGLDAQVMLTNRVSSRVATLHVPHVSGPLTLASDGSGYYRELQIAVRRTWPGDQQLFVSYVRSYTGGELNEFAAVLQGTAAALLQPAGRGRLTSDVRHRVLAWATFDLPRRVVFSPVVEWHSGFPYSAVDQRYVYAGPPNSHAFPTFFAADLVVYKTVTVRRRSADVGIQVFNLTNHRNPRDVYPVVGAPRWGTFANSVGPIVRGYMLIKWRDRS